MEAEKLGGYVNAYLVCGACCEAVLDQWLDARGAPIGKLC